MEKILVDKDGYKQFYQEMERIKEELANNASKGGEVYKDAIGDGWHDNFAFESAMAEERKIRAKLEKMYSEQSKLEIVDIPVYEDGKVNVNDIVKIRIIYSDEDIEEEMVKLTGKYIPDTDAKIQEISLNSPLGKAIYMKTINSFTSYVVGDKEFKVEIMSKCNL